MTEGRGAMGMSGRTMGRRSRGAGSKSLQLVVLAVTAATAFALVITSPVGAIPIVKPGAPAIGIATAGPSSATVTWSPPASNGGGTIIGYVITPYVLASGAPLPTITVGSVQSDVVTGLSNATTYEFTVAATNSAGTGPASGRSNPVTPEDTAPGAPTIGTATPGNGSATVTWTAPASNGGIMITNYLITPYIGATAQTGITVGNVLSYDVTGLTNGTTYTFTVAAINDINTGPPSGMSNAVTPATAPGAPTIGTATPGNASATVTWSPPTSDGGSPISGYLVTPYIGTTAQTGTAVGNVLGYDVTGLTNGSTYTFTVAAINAINTGPASGPSNAVTPATAPGAPTIGVSTAGHASATVTWSPPTSDGGSPITNYLITPYIGTTAQNGITVGDVDSDVVTGLTNGAMYTFTVAAINAINTGPPSAQSNPVTPMGVAPGAPTIGTATPGDESATVTWKAPASDGGSPITNYLITPYIGTTAQTGITVGNVLGYDVTGLTNGTTYTFTVAAINAINTGAPSGQSNAVTPASAPGAPTIGTATPGNESATVTWKAPASDGGSPITGYLITPYSGTTAQAGITVGVVTSHVVTGLTDGVSYTFTVAAINVINTGPPSLMSNAVIPTATAPGAPTIGTATAGNTAATVTWTAPASNGGSKITGYSITPYKAGVAQTAVVVGVVLSDLVTGLTDGVSYTFTVAAINAINTGPPSAQSNAVTPTATVPGAPVIGMVTPGNASATVTWSPPASNGGATILGYVVTASPGGETCTYTVVKPEVDSCTVTGLTNNSKYSFTVTATNKVGAGPASAPSVTVIPRLIVDGYQVYPGANLSGANLSDANLSTIDLTDVNFTDAILTGVTFDGSTLSGATFTGATLSGATFTGTTLGGVVSGGIVGTPTGLPSGWSLVNGYLIGPGADLAGATLTGAALSGVDLADANLGAAILNGANLGGATLTGASLTGASLSGTNLDGANLTSATLTDATLTDADLAGANLTTAIFTGASLFNATLTGATLTEATFLKASLNDVSSGDLIGTPSALPAHWTIVNDYLMGPGANLTDAVLIKADLNGVDLKGAILRGVVSGGITGTPSALPSGWKLVDGYLIGPGADLSKASLSGANLTGDNLTSATLTDATLTGANLTDANLTGANLAGAVMTHAIVTGVTWSHTTCPDSTNSSSDGGTCVGHGA